MGQASALAARVFLQLLLVLGASRPRAGGSLALILRASLPLKMWLPSESFCLGGGFAREFYETTYIL